MLKEELFTTKEIQWFTLRLYKNNHNILKMDLYSFVPRERPRLKSYGAFLSNSKPGFSNPKYCCLFVLARLPAAVREASPRSTERASGNRAYFWALKNRTTFRYLNFVSSDSISILIMIFIDLVFLGWSEGARKTYCWWRKWKRSNRGSFQFGWWSRWNHTNNITCWSPASQCFISKTRRTIWVVPRGKTWISFCCR